MQKPDVKYEYYFGGYQSQQFVERFLTSDFDSQSNRKSTLHQVF